MNTMSHPMLNETERARLKNELQELFRDQGDFTIWTDNEGRSLCGLAGWKGRRISMGSSERLAWLVGNPESFTPSQKGPGMFVELFQWLGDPVEFDDVVELIARHQPAGEPPAKSRKAAKAIEPIEPIEEVQPAAPVKPAKPTPAAKSSEPARPAKTINPIEPVKPKESAKPAKPAKPAIVNEPAKPIKPAEITQEMLRQKPAGGEVPAAEPRPMATKRLRPAYGLLTLLLAVLAIAAAIFSFRQDATGSQQFDPSEAPARPSPSPTQPGPAAAAPPASLTPTPASGGPTTSLVDGDRTLQFNETGVVSGLESFPEEIRADISEALLTGVAKRAMDWNELASAPEMKPSAWLQYPNKVVVSEDRPNFRWAPVAGASRYQVRISDAIGREVAGSEALPPDPPQWKPIIRLRRGAVYTWSVIATLDDKEVIAEARFKLLAADKMNELTKLKAQSPSHLALGLFYTREGVLVLARREFELLARENPNTPIVAKLLRQSQTRQ
jgi:hypothetical protein